MAGTATRPIGDEHIVLGAETLAGDTRDWLLQMLRHNHDALPWDLRGEAKQREVIDAAEKHARHMVDRLSNIIATKGRKAALGDLVKLQVKGGLQMQINVPASDPLAHDLFDRVGGPILLVLSAAEEFGGERAPVRIKKDQGDILDEAAE